MVGGRAGVWFALEDGRLVVRGLVWLKAERLVGGWGYWGTCGRLEGLEPLSDLLCSKLANDGQLARRLSQTSHMSSVLDSGFC
jgi:hypothetical protein